MLGKTLLSLVLGERQCFAAEEGLHKHLAALQYHMAQRTNALLPGS